MDHLILRPLPYAEDALEPHLGREAVRHHYAHHAGYLERLKELIADKPEANASLEWLIRTAEGPIFENAAQIWNHDFYWRSMRPGGGGGPGDELSHALAAGFGSLDAFRKSFLELGAGHFGSGWIWLVAHRGRVRIATTPDADLPLRYCGTPLLCCDLWEHAFYPDYQNDRGRYLATFLDHLANWEFASANWAGAVATTPALRRVVR
jgi:Fe-Mn family superoxide dismutase